MIERFSAARDSIRYSVLSDSRFRLSAVLLALGSGAGLLVFSSSWLAALLLPLAAAALAIRLWRRHLLVIPAPEYIRATRASSITPIADLQATALVAAIAVLALGYQPLAVVLGGSLVASFLILGSLRAHLLLSGLAGLLGGHEAARWSLSFFAALHNEWRARRLVVAFGLGTSAATLDFAAMAVLITGFFGAPVLVSLAAAVVMRLSVVAVGFRREAEIIQIEVPIPMPRERVTLPDEDLAA